MTEEQRQGIISRLNGRGQVNAFEAAMAAYFHSRGPLLRQYLAETPEWIVSMQKAGVST